MKLSDFSRTVMQDKRGSLWNDLCDSTVNGAIRGMLQRNGNVDANEVRSASHGDGVQFDGNWQAGEDGGEHGVVKWSRRKEGS